MREAVEEGLGEVLERARSASTRSTPRTPRTTPTSTSSPPSRRSSRRSSPRPARDAGLQLEIAADALRLPPWDAKIATLSGGEKRRVALCRLLLSQARHAAARRADQPPRRRERRVARAVPAAVSRHRGRGDARPLLPRQRGRVDPRARPRPRHSVEGQLQLVARAEGAAPRHRGRSRRRRAARRSSASSSGCARTRRAGRRRARRASQRFEELYVVRVPEAQRDQRDLHPGRRAPRRPGRSSSRTSPRRSATAC